MVRRARSSCAGVSHSGCGQKKRSVKAKHVHFEEELRRPGGTPVYVLLNAIAIKDAAGAVVEIQGSILDITEWKQAEKDLVESNCFNAEIIASVHEAPTVIEAVGPTEALAVTKGSPSPPTLSRGRCARCWTPRREPPVGVTPP